MNNSTKGGGWKRLPLIFLHEEWRTNVRTNTAIKRFLENYEKAKNKEFVNKPISYALYQTWRWADTYERPRKRQGGGA